MTEVDMESTWTGERLTVTLRRGKDVFTDRCDPGSARSRSLLVKAAVAKLPDVVAADLDAEILAELHNRGRAVAKEPDDPSQAGDVALTTMPADVVAEARTMLQSGDLLRIIADDLGHVGIVGEHDLGLQLYLTGTSRLLRKPLAAIVQGTSSSGKSHAIDCTASLFPVEATLLATDLTTNALYYMAPGSLRHRFVVAGERSRVQDDDRAQTTRALREMLSAGVLRKVLPQKNAEGAIETLVIVNPGPIAFVESTTLAEVFDEDRNRALLLASDDSAEQTARVVEAIAARYAGVGAEDVARTCARHHAAQRLLRRVDVQVPFALQLATRMPTDRPEARRAIHQVLALVQAVAFLHQFQRLDEPQHGTVLSATVADYCIARDLIAAPLARSLGAALPEHVMSFATWLRSTIPAHGTFVTSDLPSKPGCRWERTRVYELVKPLRDCGFLQKVGHEGQSTVYRVAGSLPADAAPWLPPPESLL